jgi:hypothetical protein
MVILGRESSAFSCPQIWSVSWCVDCGVRSIVTCFLDVFGIDGPGSEKTDHIRDIARCS